MFDIDNDNVVGLYWTGLNKMISAFSYGEPFSKLLIGEKVGKWLIDNGLARKSQIRSGRVTNHAID